MDIREFQLISGYDGLELSALMTVPEGRPKGIVQFSHGMAEHKERYLPFMEYLTEHGYVCVIHDHRGHGGSVKSPQDLGYFYTTDIEAVVEDLYHVTVYMKTLYPTLPRYLFSHSMGTLIARMFCKRHDGEIDKLVLCGPPTENKLVDFGLKMANISGHFYKEKQGNSLLNAMAFGSFVKRGQGKFDWLSVNKNNVEAYMQDPLCGYTFTTNGFMNLFQLQKESFVAGDWLCTNPGMSIFMMAGEEDPVIGSKELFLELVTFLYSVGYRNIHHKLYVGLRHELLNELGKECIYGDVLDFLDGPAVHEA